MWPSPAAGRGTDEVAVTDEHPEAAGKKTMSSEAGATNKPEPKVVEVKIEKVDEDYIEYLRKNPMKRPPTRTSPRHRETCRAADGAINKIVDLDEHMLEEYDTKGYAMVRVNGKKRLFRLPEGVEEDAVAVAEPGF
ncbi:unnamed protein product [Urochloa humidicola]